MIINSIYQQQQQAQQTTPDFGTIKMEDLNNNLNCHINKNAYGQNFIPKPPMEVQDEKFSIKLNLKSESFTPNFNQTIQAPKCASCLQPIEDKYIFTLMNMCWHEECLTCSQCCVVLNNSCFYKNGQLFCKEDYFKNFGTRCNCCMDLIGPSELVMRIETASTKQLIYYHLNCFKCLICDKHLQKGEEYVLRQEGIYCKYDFEKTKNRFANTSPNYAAHKSNNSNSSFNSHPSEEENSVDSIKYRMVLANQNQNEQIPKKSNSRRVTKRPRTILNAAQRYDFREAFKQSQKPCRKVREHLADKTGLSVRVVQVWFQNERAKMKKMQRRQQQLNKFGDAGINNKKKVERKKPKKETMSNDEDESGDDDDSDLDSEDLSDDDESLDLDENESQMNNQNIPDQQGFQGLQFNETDNLMLNSINYQQNENECINLMNLQYPPQQHCQLQQLQPNPITRLYSMQNSYF